MAFQRDVLNVKNPVEIAHFTLLPWNGRVSCKRMDFTASSTVSNTGEELKRLHSV